MTVHSRSKRTPRLKYLCLECRRTFTDLTGTPFAGSKLPLRTWLHALSLAEYGLTNAELARATNVKWETADRMTSVLEAGLASPGFLRDLRAALERSRGRAPA